MASPWRLGAGALFFAMVSLGCDQSARKELELLRKETEVLQQRVAALEQVVRISPAGDVKITIPPRAEAAGQVSLPGQGRGTEARQIICTTCGGTGQAICSRCNGSGRTRSECSHTSKGYGHPGQGSGWVCSDCGMSEAVAATGSRGWREEPCYKCGGRGRDTCPYCFGIGHH